MFVDSIWKTLGFKRNRTTVSSLLHSTQYCPTRTTTTGFALLRLTPLRCVWLLFPLGL